MTRKIIEDIKINKRPKIVKLEPSNNFITKEEPIFDSSREDISKYDFLKKKNLEYPFRKMSQTPMVSNKKRSFSKFILLLFIISLLIGIYYLFSTILFKANVTVVTKNKTFDLKQQKFTASKQKLSQAPFELMIVSDSITKDVVLTSSANVSNKAKGEITLYNEYSANVKKIKAGTFVSDEDGKTYKIDNTISIPGYTKDNNKIIPGEISSPITSFLPGQSYNGSPTLFHFDSYKGTTKYDKIYGKLSVPLTGGNVGLVYSMNEEDKASALANVGSIKDKLLRKISAQVPQDYILYDNAMIFSYDLGEGVTSSDPNTKIEIKGTLKAFIIKKDELAKSIISELLPSVSTKEKSEIVLPDISPLSFNFENKDQSIDKSIENFDFNLTGSLYVNWTPNQEELKDQLLDKDKSEINNIFKQDPGIDSASVDIIPFWSSKLPNDKKNINIIFK